MMPAKSDRRRAVLIRFFQSSARAFCLLIFGLILPASAADKTDGATECRWADTPIVIDGKANDAAWKGAQVITSFAMPWLGPGFHPARTATRARLLWDRDYLYFFAEMEDADLFADVTEHDGKTWDNDVFELFFKPARDKTGYYEFQVNTANTRLDMFLPSRGSGGYEKYKSDGEFHLESAVVLRGTLNRREDKDKGWSVEGKIPWRDFMRTGGRPKINEEWTFTLCRYDYSIHFEKPALSATAPLTQASFHRFEDYAPLRFVGLAKSAQPFGIERRTAWTNSHVIGSPNPPALYRTTNAFPQLKVHLPVAIANEPGSDRLLFLEHTSPGAGTGKLRRFKSDPTVTEAETLLELEDIAYGLTFHPGFKTNGFIYIGGNGPANVDKKQTRIARYTIEREPPFRIDPKSKVVIIEWDSNGHNGGDMAFGLDGMLYVTSGDGTSDSDGNIAGQDLTKLTSKVLRIDVEHPAGGKQYSIPKDNPFLDVPNVRGETWAYGLRNPWRITVDRESGRIWVGENGQDLWEMARLLERGANYGWSVYEGSHPFNLQRQLGPTAVTKPTIEHSHSEFRSLTGGVVYYGRNFPDLRGAYTYGDWATGRIWGALHDGQKMIWHRELLDTAFAITGFGTDEHGELLVIDEGSGFHHLEPVSVKISTPKFPTKLSETGLFASVKKHQPNPALIPYSVNSPLWSDGASKERFIALPGTNQIEFTHNRAWGFPEGAVLVKTFSLDLKEGSPASRRRIETRLFTKQQNEWAGYTYQWNEAQTEATLVAAAGLDQRFTIRDAKAPGGVRQQTWHFPSRTECMVCHSRAVGFVLGLTEGQMNKTHDYGKVADNQIRVLEHLGVLRMNWTEYERGSSARKLADPYDAKADLNARARSYLQANCAHCHVEAGGGNSLMDLEFQTKPAQMKIFDVRPQHHTFDIADAKLVAPGHPERSVLLHRIAHLEAGHMPPLATSMVDREAVEFMREWIRQLPPDAGQGDLKNRR